MKARQIRRSLLVCALGAILLLGVLAGARCFCHQPRKADEPDGAGPTYNRAAPAPPDATGTDLAEAAREAERRMKELEAEGVQWDLCLPPVHTEEEIQSQDEGDSGQKSGP